MILPVPSTAGAALFPEVAITEPDERTLIEALGQMATTLETTYDLYVRAPALHVRIASARAALCRGAIPWSTENRNEEVTVA